MFDWIVAVLDRAGYPGIALLMFLENVFPPIPSELIMPLVGFTAARGEFSLPLAVLSGSLGSLAGAFLWYLIGLRFGRARVERLAERHGRWLTLSAADIERASVWFKRYGGAAVFIGRMVPTIRTLISVPAGIHRMPVGQFLTFSAFGTLGWTGLLTAAGYVLEAQYHDVSTYLNPISTVVMVALLLWYLWRVATFRPEPQSHD
jgi:membrane protein DedA with SNARE-associated domain